MILKDQTRGEGLAHSRSMKFSDYSDVKCSQANKVKTPELEKFLQVPWEVPKLRKKIAHRKTMKTLVNIQGSDSGISMSSQETKDILTTPAWNVKARGQCQVYLSHTDPPPPAQAEHCARVEDDSHSERYSSCPPSSLNAIKGLHFHPRSEGNH